MEKKGWKVRWNRFKDNFIIGTRFDTEDEYQEEYNTYLSEFDTTEIEGFIQQELDKAREEGIQFSKRVILNHLNTTIGNSEVFVKAEEGTEEVTEQVQDIIRMFTRRVMKDFDKLNKE